MSVAARLGGRAEWIAGLGALAFAGALLTHPAPQAAVAGGIGMALAVGALVVWIVWQDCRHYTISDAAVLGLAAIAVAGRLSAAAREGDPAAGVFLAAGLDVFLCGGLLLAFREIFFRIKGYDGLGLGDVKLAAAGALLVGAPAFAWALFAASAAGLALVVARRCLALVAARRRLAPAAAPVDRIAFGAALAPALWCVWLLQGTAPALLPPPAAAWGF